MHDELKWIDIQEHAVKILNAKEKTIFVSSDELMYKGSIIQEAVDMGYKVITIPSILRDKIKGTEDIKGDIMIDLDQFKIKYNESFQFNFINISNLSKDERMIYELTEDVLNLIGGRPKIIKEIKISEKMRKDFVTNVETTGLWDPNEGRIIIKRSQLNNIYSYAGTLLHEVAHALSRAPDATRQFESELTSLLGNICNKILK